LGWWEECGRRRFELFDVVAMELRMNGVRCVSAFKEQVRSRFFECAETRAAPHEQTRKANADPSTHHPQAEVRLGPLSLRMTVHLFCNSLKRVGLLLMNKGRRATADPSAAVGMTVWW
jgi:hypothetical protein